MTALVVTSRSPLRGAIRVPGDKSISHRAALLGGIASGTTTVDGFLRGEDCLATVGCLRAMGVRVDDDGTRLVIHGGALAEPEAVLDVGNSGTTIRLLSGILAGQPFHSVVTGDASIRRRPMDRVTTPLRLMGARITGRQGGRLAPLAIEGGGLTPITYDTPVASAQVKSAVLLAGLFADGETTVREPSQSRDHTERMLAGFGVPVHRDGLAVRLRGPAHLTGTALRVPGDLSVGRVLPGGRPALVPGIGADGRRRRPGTLPAPGCVDVLEQMGADVRVRGRREEGGEPVGTVTIRASRLRGTVIGGSMIPRAIDELPVIAVAACLADGETVIRDAAELRVKESDRIASLARELGALGAKVEPRPDGLAIVGVPRLHGGRVSSGGDHRIAMAMAVAGLCADGPVEIDDPTCIQTSFPEFEETLRRAAGG